LKTCSNCGKEIALRAISIFHLLERGAVYCPYCGSKQELDQEMLKLKVKELKDEVDRSYLLSKYAFAAALASIGVWFIDVGLSGDLERMYNHLPVNLFHAGMRSMVFFLTASLAIMGLVFWFFGLFYSYKITRFSAINSGER